MSQSQVSPLDLAALSEVDDGLLAAAFAANLKIVVADLKDRPSDDRARKLTLELNLTPEALGGDLDRVKLEWKVKNNIAGHEGRECMLQPRMSGRDMLLMFATIGTDARQPHLPMDDE